MIRVSVADKVITTYTKPWFNITTTKVDYDALNMYKEWCKINVGRNKWNYYGPEKKTPCVFKFKRDEDATAFKLTFLL